MPTKFDSSLDMIVAEVAAEGRAATTEDIARLRQLGVHSVEDLIGVLDHGDGEDRQRACWVLGRLEDPRLGQHLVRALFDPESGLRIEAAKSLGTLAAPDTIPELVRALTEEGEPDVRSAIAAALGLTGDERAVDPLLAKLGDTSEQAAVRGAAAEALTGPRSPRAVDPLIAALADPEAEVRFWAAFALGQLGDERAIPALEQLARSDTAVLEGWGRISDEASEAISEIRARPVS
ncbi:MAG TPA: HEAT repeat domain-containing protein [Polyangia bacterium]|nr:HEAT repeat domain-containing protein [Polyangia bacterium]